MNAVLGALTSLGFDWHVALANLVNFFIIFFILKHFFFGTIQKTLAERKEKIQKGLDDAQSAAHLLENAENEKKQILKTAELEASAILLATETKSLGLAESITNEAQDKAKQILTEVQKNISKQEEMAFSELYIKAPQLVAETLEKILRGNISKEVNENYIKSLMVK